MAVAVLLSLTVCRYSLRRPSGDSRRLAQKFQLLRRTLLREPVTIAPGPASQPSPGEQKFFQFPHRSLTSRTLNESQVGGNRFFTQNIGSSRPRDCLPTHPGLFCQVFLTPPTWEPPEISVTPHPMAAFVRAFPTLKTEVGSTPFIGSRVTTYLAGQTCTQQHTCVAAVC